VTVRRNARTHERGTALAEFAVVLTATMLIIVGIIDFGRGLYTYHLVSNAARLASRYASVRGSACSSPGCPVTQAALQTYVRGLYPELNASGLAVTPTWTTGNGCAGTPFKSPGCNVSVQVTYTVTFSALRGLPTFNLPMSSTSQMIISL